MNEKKKLGSNDQNYSNYLFFLFFSKFQHCNDKCQTKVTVKTVSPLYSSNIYERDHSVLNWKNA